MSVLSRREFLKSATVTLIAIPFVGCGSDDEPVGSGSGGSSCQGTSATSSRDSGHTHSLCVPADDLTNPPPAGGTYATSNSGGHTHTVTLTQQNLMDINTGSAVTVSSSSDSGHTHSFTVQKA